MVTNRFPSLTTTILERILEILLYTPEQKFTEFLYSKLLNP